MSSLIYTLRIPRTANAYASLRIYADPAPGKSQVVKCYLRNTGKGVQLLLSGGPYGPLRNTLMTKKGFSEHT